MSGNGRITCTLTILEVGMSYGNEEKLDIVIEAGDTPHVDEINRLPNESYYILW